MPEVAETLLSPLENCHSTPGPALLQVFIAFGAACMGKAPAAAYGADGRANTLSWASEATGNAVAGRNNKKCHKKAPLFLLSSWKAVPASKLRHLLQVRIVGLFLESFSPFPTGFLVLWHPEKKINKEYQMIVFNVKAGCQMLVFP